LSPEANLLGILLILSIYLVVVSGLAFFFFFFLAWPAAGWIAGAPESLRKLERRLEGALARNLK
jgi:hypothetical protein